MNAITTTQERKVSPTEAFLGQVLPPQSPVIAALPAGIDPKRFRHSLQIAVMLNPKLLNLHPALVMREVAKAASLGLFLDPGLGEAYLVITRNGKTQRDEPQLRTGYRGLMKLARQSGEIANLYAQPVHANDPFEVSYGDNPRLFHQPDVFGDRGPVMGFYAFARFKDGNFDFETMSNRQIEAIRDMSDGWRAFKAGRIKATPWAQHHEEMARKTVLRRLLKRLPQSPELIEAQKIDDAEEAGLTAAPRIRQRTSAAMIEAPNGNGKPPEEASPQDEETTNDMANGEDPEDADFDAEDQPEHDPATGEIIEPETEDRPSAVIAGDPKNKDYQRGFKDFSEDEAEIPPIVARDPARVAQYNAGRAAAQKLHDEANDFPGDRP